MTTDREFQTARRDYERQCAEAGSRPPAPPPMQEEYFHRRAEAEDKPITLAEARSLHTETQLVVVGCSIVACFAAAVLVNVFGRWA